MSNLEQHSRALVPINPQNRSLIPQRGRFPPDVIVFFINTSNTTVNVRWMHTDNTYKDYGELPPKSYVRLVTTYGHRWTFYDVQDGELFTTNYNSPDDEENYYAAKLPNNFTQGQESPSQNVLIHRRMQSLAYLALKSVAKRTDLRELQLPTKVKEALMEYIETKQSFLEQWEKDVLARQRRQEAEI